MNRQRTVHMIAVLLAGIAIGLFLVRHIVAGGIVLAAEAILVLWSLEISRGALTYRPEQRP